MFKDTKRLTATDTLIGQGTVFEGTVQTEANLRIEGEFHGDITSKSEIIIGEYGVAKAEIKCVNLTIAGQLYGDVTITGRLIITPSGQLIGNAIVQSIIVQEGANFNGQCKMITAQSKANNAEVESINKSMEQKTENRKAKQAV